ncbi:MAG: hypothetical protein ACFFD2_00555 [Promethearchaeota archaeon]
MTKDKIFEIEVPIAGEIHLYQTDLICNSCGKRLQNGEYLYFCMKCKDDLCSKYGCLKKHAGHSFFRWGRIETDTPIEELIAKRPAPPSATKPYKPLGPTMGVPMAPPSAPPPPIKGPTINSGALSALRTEMLKELKCLMTKMKDDDQE